MKHSDRAALASDPVSYAGDLLMQCLFPNTEAAASQKLRDESYPIVAMLVEILRRDRARIQMLLNVAQRGESTTAALEVLRESLQILPPLLPKCKECGQTLEDDPPMREKTVDLRIEDCLECAFRK